MTYEILDYRSAPGCAKGMFWMIDVRIKITESFLWFIPIVTVKWMSCGDDGLPRLYHKIAMENYHQENKLFVCKSRLTADKKIEEFKSKENWQRKSK